jgi:hypothetical protein
MTNSGMYYPHYNLHKERRVGRAQLETEPGGRRTIAKFLGKKSDSVKSALHFLSQIANQPGTLLSKTSRQR